MCEHTREMDEKKTARLFLSIWDSLYWLSHFIIIRSFYFIQSYQHACAIRKLVFRSDNFSHIYNVMYKGITFCSESHDYFPLHSMPLYLLCKLFFYLSFYLLYFLFILAIHLSPYASFYLPQQFFSFVVSKLCVRNMQALLENHFVWN